MPKNVLAELLLEDAVGKPLPEQPDKYDRNRDIYIIGTFIMLAEELRYSGEEAFKVIKNEFGFKNINSARDRIYGRKDSPRQQQRLKVILDQLRVGMRRPLPTERSSP